MKSKENTQQYFIGSSCIPQETTIKNVRLAAAYVPYEILCTLFTPLEALKKGTAFPELYSPYKKEENVEPKKRGKHYER
ncbi:spore coat associated protein CotJA [Clostridium cavendishii]|nr:spore coat associated protein CotJA [Clostridium cavendishii]